MKEGMWVCERGLEPDTVSRSFMGNVLGVVPAPLHTMALFDSCHLKQKKTTVVIRVKE